MTGRPHDYRRYASSTDPCRCQQCRASKAAYMRERRRAAAENAKRWFAAGHTHVAEGVTHGTRSAYEEHGCRCDRCSRHQPVSSRYRSTGGAA
jgi:queuine/archaeosine tRNA-ribosyltransferase